jgi:hypothetical protein
MHKKNIEIGIENFIILEISKIKSLGKQKYEKNIMEPIQSSGLLVTLPLVNIKSKITFVFKPEHCDVQKFNPGQGYLCLFSIFSLYII